MNYPNPDSAGEYVNSYYTSSANSSFLRSSLQTQIVADVCVIGAGFSGLSSPNRDHIWRKSFRN